MATPPTYLGTTSSTQAWPGNNTSPKSTAASINGSLGDVLVALLGDFNELGQTASVASSPVETWTTNPKTTGSNNNDAQAFSSTAVLSADRTGLTVTVTHSSGSAWNFVVPRFTDSEGVGAAERTTGAGQSAVSLTITTQYDNSAIVYLIMDWSDDGNAARTHRTPSGGSSPIEIGHFNNPADGSATWAYVPDAGDAGAKVIGMSAPTGRDQVMVAVEVRGTAVPPGPAFDGGSFDGATFYTSDTNTTPVTQSHSQTWNVSSSLSKTHTQTWNTRTTLVKTYDHAWTVLSIIQKSYSQTWNTRFIAFKSYEYNWNVDITVGKTYSQAWNVKASVVKSYNVTWYVIGLVSKSYGTIWEVNESVSKLYAQMWNTLGGVSITGSNTWNIETTVSDTQQVSWNVDENIGGGELYNFTDIIGVTPPTAAATDSGGVNLGTEFYVTSAEFISKLRWWQPTTNSPNTEIRTLYLYTVDSPSVGTVVVGPLESTPVGSGWQEVELDEQYELIPNQRYRVVTHHPNGGYVSTPFVFNGSSNYTDGPVVIPNTTNATGNDQGSYYYGNPHYTDSSFNHTYYFSDVVITTDAGGLTEITKTQAVSWNSNSNIETSNFPSGIGGQWESPGPFFNDPDSGVTFGVGFAVNSSCEIGGARWLSNITKNGYSVTLFNFDTGELLHQQTGYNIVPGWNDLLWTTPYVASPGVTYVMAVWQPGSGTNYSYTATDYWGGTISHGSIYTTITNNTRFRYNATANDPAYSGAGGSSAKWCGLDVIELLSTEEDFDPTFGDTVATENGKSGTPSGEWMITGAGDTNNIGFTEKYHYDKAIDSNIHFCCHGSGTKIDIYRVGFYQGHGARKVAEITNIATTQSNAVAISNSEGGIEFDWDVTATWTLPEDVLSGFYFAVYHNAVEDNASWIPFVLADRDREASIAYKTSDFTWYGAYNYCGDIDSILTGKSVYGSGGPLGNIGTRHFVGSYRRPCVTREGVPQTYWMNSESSMIMFLEEQGIDVKYTSCIGLNQSTIGLTNINILLSNGHDEYWSDGMTENVKSLRDEDGVNLIFMSGNENFWRVFWDNTNMRMTCRKDTMNGPGGHVAGVPFIDHENWTGTWRDTRWNFRQPENEITGTWFDMNGVVDKTLTIDASEYGGHVVWRNTTVASGTDVSLPRVVGFEADSIMPTQPVGSYSVLVAQTFNIDNGKADINGENYAEDGDFTWGIVAQRFPNSVVVGFGTCQWSWCLIGTHDRTATTPNINARQMTLNLLTDLGAPPTTPAIGLVNPTPTSLDNYGLVTGGSITKTNEVNWVTNGLVIKSVAPVWNINEIITQSVAPTWNIDGSIFTVSKSYTSIWGVGVFISTGYHYSWDVGELITNEHSSIWGVRTTTNNIKSVTWNTLQSINNSTSATWTTLLVVSPKSYANTWNDKALTTGSNAINWNIRSLVTKTSVTAWNVEAIGQVSNSKTLNWNVYSQINSVKALTWNTYVAMTKSYVLAWVAKSLVFRSYTNIWNVRQSVSTNKESNWNLYIVVQSNNSSVWAVRGLAQRTVTHSWNIRAVASPSKEVNWNVRNTVICECDFGWFTTVSATNSVSSYWIVFGRVLQQCAPTWNVAEDNKWYVWDGYAFVPLTVAGVWDGTQVVPV